MGDFNAFYCAHEKRGGRLPSISACNEFRSTMERCDLACLDTIGSPFTWSNFRFGSARIEIRFDRALCSEGFFQAWSGLNCYTLPRHCSDHHPLILKCSSGIINSPKPFRFKEIWLAHSNFQEFVASQWNQYNNLTHTVI